MVVVKLQGGLGNQMFQYAAARSLSMRLNTEMYFDLSWFSNIPSSDTKRWYELDCFDIDIKSIDITKYNVISKGLGRSAKIKQYLKAANRKVLWSFESPDQKYLDEFSSLNGNIYLDGWFTSEKYFMSIRDQLLKDFKYKQKMSPENKKIIDKILSTNSVSLHVRRGDYISNKGASKWHGTSNIEYYKDAIDLAESKIVNPIFYIFSDDISWCKKNIKIQTEHHYIEGNKKGADDMRLMMQCKNNIIANSTFSWWGAWLNNDVNKLVIAPKKWLEDSSVDTSDIIPEGWIRI